MLRYSDSEVKTNLDGILMHLKEWIEENATHP
jgi:hypothetical protein